MPHVVDATSSSLTLFVDKKELSPDIHFSWGSMKKFIYTACTFSTAVYNFDLFSRIVTKVRIFEFVFCEITIGMAYMFMDCFIKQYTRKQDAHKYLNPLLKGITYGLFLQTALMALIHAHYLADVVRFLISSFQESPSWTTCYKSVNSSCVPSREVIRGCQDHQQTNFTSTSAHFNYIKSFMQYDRNVMTTRFFVIGLVWMFNFFFSTVTDDSLIKIFRLAIICRLVSTLTVILFALITTKSYAIKAVVQILDATSEHNFTASVEHLPFSFGIGFLDYHEFTSSPYTMVDNAIIMFMLIYTTLAFLRSWIVRVLYVVLTECVAVELSMETHYFLFAVLPFSTQFVYAHKLYTFYIYFHLSLATVTYLSMLTLTMSKLLHTEFRSLKNIYIVGLLCCLGFGLSIPISMSTPTDTKFRGIVYGMTVTLLYLGGFKVAIIMWMYGVQKFSTDIHFWLGFKPTKFWKTSWVLLPIVLSYFLTARIYTLTLNKDTTFKISATVWIIVSVLIVGIVQIKTIAKYLVRNNLAAAFSSSIKYGPPDPEDRRRRRHFDETIHLRQCHHNCHILDDTFDCNHLPLMQKNVSGTSVVNEVPVKDIFEEGPSTRMRTSIVVDINQHH